MHNPMDLTGRVVLVTGASSGIGRGAAILLSRLGARVILTGRDEARLRETLSRMEGEGHIAETFDLATNVETIPQWLKGLAARTGPLHGLVHSAGISRVLPIQSVNVNRINDVVTINLTTSLMLAKAFRQKGCFAPEGSSIVLLSSIAAMIGKPALSIYSATKAGLIGATRSLALEFARERIRVNCIAPGAVLTEMWSDFEKINQMRAEEIESSHPLGVGTVEDVANGIAFLIANTGRWITGAVLMMDGGCTAQ